MGAARETGDTAMPLPPTSRCGSKSSHADPPQANVLLRVCSDYAPIVVCGRVT